MVESMPRVNRDRLWADLESLGAIGRGERGISRLAFTPADMEGRKWLLARMAEAGMQARIDEVGNVIGEIPGLDQGPAIVIGSHTDTVPEGGMFDGALGVLGGLEVARSLMEVGMRLRHPLKVVSFANEEGSRIIPGTFGSRWMMGTVQGPELSRLAPVLAEAGLPGGAIPSAPIRGAGCAYYLELHIEQGGILDAAGEDIGVVTGIVWITSFTATFRGVANHAGTTPMGQRQDALLGAAELILAIPELVKTLGGPATVGTCGQVQVLPGGRNVIPGEVTMSVEVRDLEQEIAMRVLGAIREAARRLGGRRGLTVELTDPSANPGAKMHEGLMALIEQAASGLGYSYRRMPSGAGHDAMNMAAAVPAGMIFVPSKGGISHSPHEWTSKEQCAAGANVLLNTVIAADRL
ncbi:MAG: Zn-dependent hydrolase [Bacillota bacterium]